jgi:hypothetical protein
MRAKEHTKRHALTTEVSSPTEAPVTDIKTCTIGMIHLKAFFFWKSLNALHVTSKIAITFSELSQSLNLAKRGWVSRSVPVFRLYMTRDSAKSDGKLERDESKTRGVTDIELSEFRLEAKGSSWWFTVKDCYRDKVISFSQTHLSSGSQRNPAQPWPQTRHMSSEENTVTDHLLQIFKLHLSLKAAVHATRVASSTRPPSKGPSQQGGGLSG